MSQHDYVIANASGASVRTDINAVLQAIVSSNSGATEPATMYAYMYWADTTTGLLKQRNAANDAWITIGPLANLIALAQLLTAAGDIVYASGANVPARLAKGAAYKALVMNSAATFPEWGDSAQSILTAAGDLLYASAANVLARLAKGAAYKALVMNSAGTLPAWGDSPQSILTAAGDLLYASAANTLARLAKGTARLNLAMNSGATAPEWVASLQSIITEKGDIIYGSAANTPAALVHGDSGQFLMTQGHNAIPKWADIPVPDAIGGPVIVAGAMTLRETTSGVYVKLKEIRVLRAGTYWVTFELTGTDVPKGRIYKNTAAFGTERTGAGIYIELLTFAANDLVQLYVMEAGATGPAGVQDFTIGVIADNRYADSVTD